MKSKFNQIFEKSNNFYNLANKSNSQDRLLKIAEALHTVVPEDASMGKPSRGVIYVEPDFEAEFEEAKRYPDFQSKESWFRAVIKGKVTPWGELGQVNNHSDDIESLDPEKKDRVETSILRDKVEYPIVGKWPNGELEMISGNTRVAMLRHMGHEPMVWLIDVPIKKAAKSHFFKKLAQIMVAAKSSSEKVEPFARSVKDILAKSADEKDLEEWQKINEKSIEPLNSATNIVYMSDDFFILSNEQNEKTIYAISKLKQNKSNIEELIEADNIDFNLSEEFLLRSFKSVPTLFIFKFKKTLSQKKNESVFFEAENGWIENLLNNYDFFIDESEPLKRFTRSDVLDFIEENKAQIQKIRSNLGASMPVVYEKANVPLGPMVKEPIELGSGQDGVAFDIGDQKVLKIFKSKYALDSLKRSEDLMHSAPSLGKTEIMNYDFGELDYNGKTAYYSIMPKLETFPVLELKKIDFDAPEERAEKSNLFKKYVLDNKNISKRDYRILLQRKKDIEQILFLCENDKLYVGGKKYSPEDFLKMDADALLSFVDAWKYKKTMSDIGSHLIYVKSRMVDLINNNLDEINRAKMHLAQSKSIKDIESDVSVKIDNFVNQIVKALLRDPRLSLHVEAINATNKLIPNWLEDFVREMLTKYLTGRIDLHMGNLGIDKGRLRHFDAASNGDSDKIDYEDMTLKS